ncbi:FAD/NAD-P-binding domain-containing protein [Mycena metata]|uniref:L-ornithine N(5)-monooxygenase [NAD(P)H] n=1 Tax=Mycena metata TaxID=1033252 RepID=A0AAD7JQB2_9AGAR|nr:FAD/NAD-P-binding domain-containing protein [Mycena metata]
MHVCRTEKTNINRGLITARTLLTGADGFDVQVITRDRSPGGQWAKERIYPGLQLNNVHGEFRFSARETVSAPEGSTGDTLLPGKIMFETKILKISRGDTSGEPSCNISVKNCKTGRLDILRFYRVVLCTGGTSKARIPDYLSSTVAQKANFSQPIIHSADFGNRLEDILNIIPPSSSEISRSIVIIGGGKSAQDISAYLANQGREVTVVYERTGPSIAGARPLPDFMRKSRLLSILSPYISLRTRLDKFVRETWNSIMADSFKAMGIREDSPLRLTFSLFWNVQTNDEGVPRPNGFHALVNEGKINVIAPARMTGYAGDGHSILLNNGPSVKADLLILATGYASSWTDIFDEKTAADIGLYRHQLVNYKSLRDPPPLQPENTKWSSSIYKAILATNDGYSFEVTAHWISSYFLGDKMNLPRNADEALKHAEREAMWLFKRHPDLNLSLNEACTSYSTFWTWPQYSDELLEDMYLQSMRSGGNWFTWPFQVISINELATLHEEREANRRKNV